MKNIMTILMVLATQFALASELMAASGIREDSSMFVVWMFLGMCALIVIIQLMPAIFLTFGLIKSLYSSTKSQVKVKAIIEE